MNARRSVVINSLIKICDKVSNAIMRDFYELEKLQVSKKDLGGFVTNADIKAEKIIIRELSYLKPESNFLLEERGVINNNDYDSSRWIVDAIDGTTNFMRGNPHFCVSIALEDEDEREEREIIACVVYCPISRELYWAEKGKGAYLVDNAHVERRIKVSPRAHLSDAVGAMSSSLSRYSAKEQKIQEAFKSAQPKLRMSGSTVLDMAYVASGRFDFCVYDNIKIWDVASGILLIREAGGTVADFQGNVVISGGCGLIASNGVIHESISVLLT